MIAYDFLYLTCFGGLFGFFGQLIRILVGLKKRQLSYSGFLDTQRLIITSLLGFLIGAIALILLHQDMDEPIGKSMIITLISIGYAGVDFIEGLFLFSRHMGK